MFRNFISNASKSAGLDPGTPIYTGDVEKVETVVTVIEYDGDNCFSEHTISDIKDYLSNKKKGIVSWINIDGLNNSKIIEDVGNYFQLHPLMIEDILNISQRPKFEEFDNFLFVILKMIYLTDEKLPLVIEQVSLLVSEDIVISFQEDKKGDVFGGVRDRIKLNKGKIRKLGTDYLAYSLIDSIIDNYFVILEDFGEGLENIENVIINNPRAKNINRLHYLKQKLIFLRKSIWPLREVIGGILRTDHKLIKDSSKIFFRDVYEHTIQVIEIIETFRDTMSSLIDIFLSSTNNKLNETMKVLTMISTTFIPMSFIASFYGMNFKYMPELSWNLGYPMVIAIMLGVMATMLLFFIRKKWL